jgi:hypothetical protein
MKESKVPCIGDVIKITHPGRPDLEKFGIVVGEDFATHHMSLKYAFYEFGSPDLPKSKYGYTERWLEYRSGQWFIGDHIKADIVVMHSPYNEVILRNWKECKACKEGPGQECFACKNQKDHRILCPGSGMPIAPRPWEKITPFGSDYADPEESEITYINFSRRGLLVIKMNEFLKNSDWAGYLGWISGYLYNYLTLGYWHPDYCDHSYITDNPREVIMTLTRKENDNKE